MMHEAYNVCLLSKLSVHVESMAAYGNNIILGTRKGELLTYYIEKNVSKNKMELKLLNFDKTFSKKPIIQIEVVPEEFLLFTLSDNMISVSYMKGVYFPIDHIATQTKGTSVFCVDIMYSKSTTCEMKTTITVCAAIKRKLQFYSWDGEKLVDKKTSIELKELPKAISMFENNVCVGFKNEYVLYNILPTPVKHDLINTASCSNQDPCICLLGNLFGLIKNQYLALIDPNEYVKPIPKFSGNNEYKSESVLTSEKTTMLERSKDHSKPKGLDWSQSVLDLVWDEPYIIGRTANCLEIRCFDSNDLNKEPLIQTFPELGKARILKRSGAGTIFAAAISELWFIESVDISKQIQSLLNKKKFQLAIDLTNTSSKTEKEKKEIIKKIQTKFAKELFNTNQFSSAMDEFLKAQTDAYDVIRLYIRLFPNLFPNDSQQLSPSHTEPDVTVLEEKDLEMALVALQEYIESVKKETIARKNQIGGNDKEHLKISTLLSILDTTLLKTYIETNDTRIEELLRTGYCHFEESEKTLKNKKKYSELNILYNKNQKHEKALDLLKYHSTKSETRIFACEQAIKYLQSLGPKHKKLIFEHSEWVLEIDSKAGLKIFTENFDEVKNLPRAEVLDVLLTRHKALVIPYLEHLIDEWKEEKATFHSYLIRQYRIEIDNLKNDILKNGETPEKIEGVNKIRSKLQNFLKTSKIYTPENVLKDLPTKGYFEERAIILGILKKHVKVLVIYIQILGDIEKAIEYCEQVYPEENNIMVLLIQKLLSPPNISPYNGVELHSICLKPNTDKVLNLLDKYGTKIDPIEVLKCLPDDIPLSRLQNYLETSLRSSLERRRNSQIISGLLHADYSKLSEQLMNDRMKSIVLTDFTICPTCKKRFTNQSAFVRYPDGKIVHLSCQDKIN